MKWNKTKGPKVGDIRIIKRPCLFPRLVNGEYCWLEWVEIEQKCSSYPTMYGIGGGEYLERFCWEDVRFIT